MRQAPVRVHHPGPSALRPLPALACLALAAVLAQPGAAETFDNPLFSSELVTTVTPFGPVGVAWAPDGRMFIWLKNGIVRVLETDGTLLPTPFLDFSSKVNTFNDNGMLGLTFAPDFATSGHIYLTYIFEPGSDPNDASPKTGRLVRVTADPADHDRMLAGSEVTILDGFPVSEGTHVLGTIRFAPDGAMFFGNGDGASPSAVDPNAMGAQDLDNVRGKIFRVNPDGTARADNPFYDGTNSIRSKVWAYGVRNPYRFSLHAVTGEPYIGDVGWNAWEEVDIGARGGNFGWPCFEGTLPQPEYQSQFPQCAQIGPVIPPIAEYNHATGDLGHAGTCMVGGDFFTGTEYPVEYRGNYFYADYSGNWIHRVLLDANGLPTGTASFATSVPVPVSVEQGPDGLLYYVSFSTGQIRRIRYNGPKAVASATPTYGYSPLQVAFSSQGSASAIGPLIYSWNFGDGGTSTAANPTHTYVAGGVQAFTATLTVEDTQNRTSQSQVQVTVGSVPPVAVITAPEDGTGYMPGQTVSYDGAATDPEDGTLPGAALSWRVLLHHNTHSHAAATWTGAQGSFKVEYHGAIGTFFYELLLTATDSSGLSASTSIEIPILQDSAPPTDPAGLTAVPAGYGLIDLSWTGSSDNAAVDAYRIERCQGEGCTAFAEVATAQTASHRDAGLAGATAYRYRVRAADASLNLSGYSNEASATTLPPVQLPGLVAAYAFDEGLGSVATDASPQDNTGSITGASWTAAGRFGSALAFDGAEDMVAIADAPSLDLTSAMTLEAWVYPTALGGWRDVVYKATDAYYLEGSSTAGGAPAAGGTFSQEVVGPGPLPLNTWSHLAVTYDGTELWLYINGVPVAGRTETGAIATTSGNLTIGGDAVFGQYWEGRIDEVRVYNRALGQGEIQTDMVTSVGITCADADADGRCALLADCDDANPQVWAVPGEVGGAAFVDPSTLTWNPPAPGGGSAWTYDVLQSDDAADFTTAAVCVESGDGADATAAITETPAPQLVRYYLVRARNACPQGVGSLGQGSGAQERLGRACP